MLYGSEAWPIKDDDVKRLQYAEKNIMRWMCSMTVRDGPTGEELRSRLRIGCISDKMRRARLHSLCYVEEKR